MNCLKAGGGMKAKLLGCGSIYENGTEEIILSFKKAYALLFYLLIERSATREHVVNLLWGELSDDSAKKNLRNAVYVIRKTFNDNIIMSPKRDILVVDIEQFDWVDVFSIDTFTADDILNLQDVEFLCGFNLKDAPYFDTWLTNQKYHYNEKLAKRVHALVEESLENQDSEKAEKLARVLLEFDEFDESAYRLLFKALELQGKYSSVASSYNTLCETLDEELMLKPDDETKRLFEEIMMVKSREEISQENRIYGRKEEINILKAALYKHIKTQKSKSILLIGGSGIGKSTILQAFSDEIEDQHTVFFGKCYKAELEFPLSPWFALLDQIADQAGQLPENKRPKSLTLIERITSNTDFMMTVNDEKKTVNSYRVEKAIFEVFDALLAHKRVVIVFEDIQWMDKLSLKLFIKLMERPVFIASSINTDYASADYIMEQLVGIAPLNKQIVEPFNKLETFEFVKMMNSSEVMSVDTLETLYEESQGNPLFITEMLNAYDWSKENGVLPSRVIDVMNLRFDALERDEKKLLNIASNFYDHFNYEDLKSISGMDEFVILDSLGQLVRKQILKEVKRGSELLFSYSHHVFREHVYNSLPLSVRRVYHMKIGQQLEKTAGDTPSLNRIYRLLYNYSMAGNAVKELKYRIQFVSDYFDVAHEMFPVVGNHNHNDSEYATLVDISEIHNEIERIERLYQEVEADVERDADNRQMKFSYYKLVGRYSNIKGNYEKAYALICKMYALAEETSDSDALISALLLFAYYYINIRDLKALDETLNAAFVIAKNQERMGMQGVLLRLKGYSKILGGQFELGISTLKQAIKIFDGLSCTDQYTLNIVGAHYYIGEGYRFGGKFKEAMAEYNQAVELCKSYGYKDKLAFLYGSIGQVYYEVEDYAKAQQYLEKAKQLYEHVEGAWGKTMTLGYYSLVLLRKNRYKETLKLILLLDESFARMNNPYHKALVYRIKGEICYFIKQNPLKNPLSEYIECNDSNYCMKAMDSFSKLNSVYDVEIMEKMTALCSKCMNPQ